MLIWITPAANAQFIDAVRGHVQDMNTRFELPGTFLLILFLIPILIDCR